MFWQTGWKKVERRQPRLSILTQYVGKKSVRIFRSAISAGSFDAFHIKIKSSEAVLKKLAGRRKSKTPSAR